MKLKELKEAVGSLSAPSKMPCSGYSIPAKECNVGSRLVGVENSTCSGCYALKGRYVFPNVEKAMYHRYNSLLHDTELWTKNMITYIGKFRKGDKRYFRWHDSGDLQNINHLTAINEIALALPEVQFWLPTREIKIVRLWQQLNGEFSPNLIVRISAHMNDAQPNHKITGYASGVIDKNNDLQGSKCPAPNQGNECLDCRACWTTETVLYHKH
jgi:hypothetical protein